MSLEHEREEYGPWQSKLALLLNKNINTIGNAAYFERRRNLIPYLPLALGFKSALVLKEQVKLMLRYFDTQDEREKFAKELFERLSNDS